jgi:fatty aldehyde-generating acyl-ACP reductase
LVYPVIPAWCGLRSCRFEAAEYMPPLEFALIGHSESWATAAAVISLLRGTERSPIPLEDIREIVPWIPPRAASRITARSLEGHCAHGVYIDSFIPPDRLDGRFLRENLARVRQAASCAIRAGARIVTLGGFSSILLEGVADLLPSHPNTAFTTGNTLTVALIIKGLERALELAGRDVAESSVLIVGASGDVGSGCARCLAPRVKQLLLCARNPDRLNRFALEFRGLGRRVACHTDLERLSRKADVVICAASMPAPELLLNKLPGGAIVCDAGHPKNLPPSFAPVDGAVFYGGMGQASGGIKLDPDLLRIMYPYPLSNVGHGCLLEGVVLALDKRFEPFSRGRGLITPRRVEHMWGMAQTHGIGLPPLFNRDGPMEGSLLSVAEPQALRMVIKK